MAVTYDETVIIEFATRLYRRAASLIAICVVLGMIPSASAGPATKPLRIDDSAR
jgi:hypothetical protein